MGSTADKVKGATNETIGKAKQGVGEAIGSDKLQGYAMPAMTNLDDGCLPLHVEQLDVEHQRRVRRNGAAGAAGAVAQRGRNDQGTLAADFHGGDAFIPAGDHPALPDRKLERLVAIDRRVEFLALLPVLIEPAGVMHDANLTGLRRSAGADRAVNHLQA